MVHVPHGVKPSGSLYTSTSYKYYVTRLNVRQSLRVDFHGKLLGLHFNYIICIINVHSNACMLLIECVIRSNVFELWLRFEQYLLITCYAAVKMIVDCLQFQGLGGRASLTSQTTNNRLMCSPCGPHVKILATPLISYQQSCWSLEKTVGMKNFSRLFKLFWCSCKCIAASRICHSCVTIKKCRPAS